MSDQQQLDNDVAQVNDLMEATDVPLRIVPMRQHITVVAAGVSIRAAWEWIAGLKCFAHRRLSYRRLTLGGSQELASGSATLRLDDGELDIYMDFTQGEFTFEERYGQ